MQIRTICVCGAGTMGSGIAQTAASSGYKTILFDLNEKVLQNAKVSIEKGLTILVDKGKIPLEKKKEITDKITFTKEIKDCRADIVIEAIVEKIDAKISLFNQLADDNHASIFATNTSSISIAAIAAGVKTPERVVGMHFFNPPALMKLVEIVKTDRTDEQVISLVTELAKKMGKTPVLCKDSPGFIVNRVARPYYIESLRLIEEGHADIETVDALMESAGFKMGPFRLMDLIGNDINYAVSCSVYDQLGKPERLKPSEIQKEKVGKGELGRKTGKGYYEY